MPRSRRSDLEHTEGVFTVRSAREDTTVNGPARGRDTRHHSLHATHHTRHRLRRRLEPEMYAVVTYYTIADISLRHTHEAHGSDATYRQTPTPHVAAVEHLVAARRGPAVRVAVRGRVVARPADGLARGMAAPYA